MKKISAVSRKGSGEIGLPDPSVSQIKSVDIGIIISLFSFSVSSVPSVV
jgi:hypothetical protein